MSESSESERVSGHSVGSEGVVRTSLLGSASGNKREKRGDPTQCEVDRRYEHCSRGTVRALAVQANVVTFTHHEGKVLWSEEATSWA